MIYLCKKTQPLPLLFQLSKNHHSSSIDNLDADNHNDHHDNCSHSNELYHYSYNDHNNTDNDLDNLENYDAPGDTADDLYIDYNNSYHYGLSRSRSVDCWLFLFLLVSFFSITHHNLIMFRVR